MNSPFKTTLLQLRQDMIQASDVPNFDLQGISDAEIYAVEAQLGFNMPQVYRDFLNVFGHVDNERQSDFWEHFCLAPAIITHVEYVIKLTKEESDLDVEFPDNALIVKNELDGGWYGWVLCDGAENPLLHGYDYEKGKMVKPSVYLSDPKAKQLEAFGYHLSDLLLWLLKNYLNGIKLTTRIRPLERLGWLIVNPLSEAELKQALTDIANDLSAYDNSVHQTFLVDALLRRTKTYDKSSELGMVISDILSRLALEQNAYSSVDQHSLDCALRFIKS